MISRAPACQVSPSTGRAGGASRSGGSVTQLGANGALTWFTTRGAPPIRYEAAPHGQCPCQGHIESYGEGPPVKLDRMKAGRRKTAGAWLASLPKAMARSGRASSPMLASAVCPTWCAKSSIADYELARGGPKLALCGRAMAIGEQRIGATLQCQVMAQLLGGLGRLQWRQFVVGALVRAANTTSRN
jgi:hypothetical protein